MAYVWIIVHFLYVIIDTGVAIGYYTGQSSQDTSLRAQYAVTLALLILAFPFCLVQVMSVVHVAQAYLVASKDLAPHQEAQ